MNKNSCQIWTSINKIEKIAERKEQDMNGAKKESRILFLSKGFFHRSVILRKQSILIPWMENIDAHLGMDAWRCCRGCAGIDEDEEV